MKLVKVLHGLFPKNDIERKSLSTGNKILTIHKKGRESAYSLTTDLYILLTNCLRTVRIHIRRNIEASC